jgi:hypothetical protein
MQAAVGCHTTTESTTEMKPQTVAMLITPKVFPDFDRPDATISAFFAHYRPLTQRAAKVIVILAVGSGDHILRYRGPAYWEDEVDWARTTDQLPISNRPLTIRQIAKMRESIALESSREGIDVDVYDLMDSGGEFNPGKGFKYGTHPECTVNNWGMFDVRARLQADASIYASRPTGINEGDLCGEFLVDQITAYLSDLGFKGILFGNQLGTRGRWTKGDGPGYSDAEAAAIKRFLTYARSTLKEKTIMWSDSYNTVQVEHDTWSFPSDSYSAFDYIVASGFCVIPATQHDQYMQDLNSKLGLKQSRILASLDYVDPWYSYRSMSKYSDCSERLEGLAVEYRTAVDGIWFLANDADGAFVPQSTVNNFARRFFK